MTGKPKTFWWLDSKEIKSFLWREPHQFSSAPQKLCPTWWGNLSGTFLQRRSLHKDLVCRSSTFKSKLWFSIYFEPFCHDHSSVIYILRELIAFWHKMIFFYSHSSGTIIIFWSATVYPTFSKIFTFWICYLQKKLIIFIMKYRLKELLGSLWHWYRYVYAARARVIL